MVSSIYKGEKFIKDYYSLLCKTDISHYYTPTTILRIGKEKDRLDSFTDKHSTIIYKYQKNLERVFVSCMDTINTKEEEFMVCVVGQFVYKDETVRFSHNFIVKEENNNFYILVEVCRFLNEEIVYDKVDSLSNLHDKRTYGYNNFNRYYVNVSCPPHTKKQDIVECFSKYGRIFDVFSKKEGFFKVEFADHSTLKAVQNDGNIIFNNKGFKILPSREDFKH
ncbi:hypothetical protein CWI38_2219p0020 [Hamiltosporidium tvaerminnensis]|uniref:NTF2 domain-containing protein n=2 Tax=Hamiltosporidium TaxID=1176354 RepID=A0A4Q9KYL1_9MICR|nr:hypothetical protein CWI39_1912p0020 [Hamiltosporidium magnivora]TBU08800.1 hypothetical protein CWI38_2219p0020 [Hamiltosporidium tvaerminnensis]